jgi:hypothetical protein
LKHKLNWLPASNPLAAGAGEQRVAVAAAVGRGSSSTSNGIVVAHRGTSCCSVLMVHTLCVFA